MRRFGFLYPVLAMVASTLAVGIHFAERVAAICLALIDQASSTARELLDAVARPALSTPGVPSDPALVQSMRHEAGLHRRSATRGG